jgi:hypothetical protein
LFGYGWFGWLSSELKVVVVEYIYSDSLQQEYLSLFAPAPLSPSAGYRFALIPIRNARSLLFTHGYVRSMFPTRRYLPAGW